MLLPLLITTALAMPSDPVALGGGQRPSEHRVVSVSRSEQSRWHDSGVISVWDGVPTWIRSLGMCIRQHESHHNYKARNRRSSAAGAYQYLFGTWSGTARWVKIAKPYAHKPASSAPPHVQDAVFIHSIQHGGIKAWRGTWCPGT